MAERVRLVLSPFLGRTRTPLDAGTNRTSSAFRRVAMALHHSLGKSPIPVPGKFIIVSLTIVVSLNLMEYFLSCPQCKRSWTSMKGRVAFWFRVRRQGDQILCEALFKLFGQQCNFCNQPHSYEVVDCCHLFNANRFLIHAISF